eukprot:13545427-Alexandrium_andersonii.AAC.1
MALALVHELTCAGLRRAAVLAHVRADSLLLLHVAVGVVVAAPRVQLQGPVIAAAQPISATDHLVMTHIKAHAGHPWN